MDWSKKFPNEPKEGEPGSQNFYVPQITPNDTLQVTKGEINKEQKYQMNKYKNIKPQIRKCEN